MTFHGQAEDVYKRQTILFPVIPGLLGTMIGTQIYRILKSSSARIARLKACLLYTSNEDSTRDYRFEPYDRLQAAGRTVDKANYTEMYARSERAHV